MVFNATGTILDPLIFSIQNIVQMVEVLVGGLFGLYIILLLMRIYETRRIRKIGKEIRELKKEIQKLNRKVSLRKGPARKNK